MGSPAFAVLLILSAHSAAAPFGGVLLKATPPGSVGLPFTFPTYLRRELALQDDGAVWVADPFSRSVVVFQRGLGARSSLDLDPDIPAASEESPFDGVVGICAIPGDPQRSNHLLVRTPTPRICRVEQRDAALMVQDPFRAVQGLPAGAFLTGLDRHPSGELLTLDEAGRQALLLDLDLRVVRRVPLLGEGNPLSGSGLAYSDAASFIAGTTFGRPFALRDFLEYDRANGEYRGLAVPTDALEGVFAGGIDVGEFDGEPALYFYNVPQDQVAAVALRRVSAPPPPQVEVTRPGGGEDIELRFSILPGHGIDLVVVRENGVEIAARAPSSPFPPPPVLLRGAVGTSGLEVEARSGGLPGPLVRPLHLFNGGWIPGGEPDELFLPLPFNPAHPDFDPLDELSGLALDWRGERQDSRLYIASRRSRRIRVYGGDGEPWGSLFHEYTGTGISGLALGAPDDDGRNTLLLLDGDGDPPPGGDGLPRWVRIDLNGAVLDSGPVNTSLLAPPLPGSVDLGDWDEDGRGSYVAHDRISGKVCLIDSATMTVQTAVAAPPRILGPAGGPPGPGGATAALSNGMVLLGGGAAGSRLVTDLYLLTGQGRAGWGLFTGESLAVPDLSMFRLSFCHPSFALGCPPSSVILPGVGFGRLLGLEAAYEPSTGLELAYMLTPDAVLFEFFDGSGMSPGVAGTQGLLTRTGSRAHPGLWGDQIFDGVLEIEPEAVKATPPLGGFLPGDTQASVFFCAINTGEEELVVAARVLVDGEREPPYLEERLRIPPGLSWRRQVRSGGRASVVLELEELEGRAGTARVIAGMVGRSPESLFRRGDVDAGGLIDIADPIRLLSQLFQGGEPSPCPDATDTDDSGVVDISDPIFLLLYLFQGGERPPAPGPSHCGLDLSEDLLERCTAGGCL